MVVYLGKSLNWTMKEVRFWWVSMTPFGGPVVPLEKGRTARLVRGSIACLRGNSTGSKAGTKELPAVIEGAVVGRVLGEGSGRAGGRVREGHHRQQRVCGGEWCKSYISQQMIGSSKLQGGRYFFHC